MPTAVLVTLFGSVSTFTQLRHSSIFVKVSQETLSFLIRIQFFECLVKLLNPTSNNAKQSKRYVQEQAITVLAMVADASEGTFARVSQMRLLSQLPSLLTELQRNSTIRASYHCRSTYCAMQVEPITEN
jgi:hypothetical protein